MSFFKRNKDAFGTLKAWNAGLLASGFESCNVEFYIDTTGSNRSSGMQSYKRNMHEGDETPYVQVMRFMSKGLKLLDRDNKYSVYGFGCSQTEEHSVYKITENESPIDKCIEAYRVAMNKKRTMMSGPTSFAAAIKATIQKINKVAEETLRTGAKPKHDFWVCALIADGRVDCMEATRSAICEASNYPMAIIVVGVGDGDLTTPKEPWKCMKELDDNLPGRKFDNVQFVWFEGIKKKGEDEMTRMAFQELPAQHKFIRDNGMFHIKVPLPECDHINVYDLAGNLTNPLPSKTLSK